MTICQVHLEMFQLFFHATKHIGAEGGVICTNSSEEHEKLNAKKPWITSLE